MTTFLRQRPPLGAKAACTAVFSVDCAPRKLRPLIEEAMYECIASPSELYIPGSDPLTARWCVRWQPGLHPRTICCREVLTGTCDELELFDARVAQLAAEHSFMSELVLVD